MQNFLSHKSPLTNEILLVGADSHLRVVLNVAVVTVSAVDAIRFIRVGCFSFVAMMISIAVDTVTIGAVGTVGGTIDTVDTMGTVGTVDNVGTIGTIDNTGNVDAVVLQIFGGIEKKTRGQTDR